MKAPLITSIIKGAAVRSGLNIKETSRQTGIPYQTLRYRYKHPTTWIFSEFGAMQRAIHFKDDELREILEEVSK